SLAEATARCAGMGARSEAETLIALNNGSMRAPRLTSDGIAAVLRFQVGCADYMVAMTPDPRLRVEDERPIPAEPILSALEAAGRRVTPCAASGGSAAGGGTRCSQPGLASTAGQLAGSAAGAERT